MDGQNRVTIRPATKNNRKELIALSVKEGQEHFIETAEQCLLEADQLSLWRPVGIYRGEVAVGFAMYGEFCDQGKSRVWLDRFFIDARFQGNGYGKTALEQLLERLRQEYGCREIFLSVYEGNAAAIALYRGFGFHFNGETDINGEKVMRAEFC